MKRKLTITLSWSDADPPPAGDIGVEMETSSGDDLDRQDAHALAAFADGLMAMGNGDTSRLGAGLPNDETPPEKA